MRALDGDSASIWDDGITFYSKSLNPFHIYTNNSLRLAITSYISCYTNFKPSSSDSKDLGDSDLKWQRGYFSDNLYLGGKGQTATMTIGTQSTMTEQTDSTMVFTMNAGNPQISGMAGTAGTNTRRQFYFGADTLALFNGAKTGRDSTVTILPNGYVGINKIPAQALDIIGTAVASVQFTAPTTKSNDFTTSASASNLKIDVQTAGKYILLGSSVYSNVGIGTNTPTALLHVNNTNVLSRPLFRLGRDKTGLGIATPDSVAFMVTGMGKVSISPNTNTYGMTPADTLNLVNIMGKKSTDSLLVVHNDIVGRDSVFAVLPDGGISASGNVTIGTGTTWLSFTNNLVTDDSLTVDREKTVFADDGSYSLATGVAGWGTVMAGDNEQWADFVFASDGTVTLRSNSAKVSKTSSAGDDSLMVYDGGGGIVIKNRLGASKKVAWTINYYTP